MVKAEKESRILLICKTGLQKKTYFEVLISFLWALYVKNVSPPFISGGI